MGKADEGPEVRRALALLGSLGPVRARAMFGGHGLYLDDTMFALIAWDRLYFRVDAETEPRWAAAGGEPFVYDGKGKPIRMPYRTAPAAAEADPDALLPWAELALAAARRVKAAKPAKTKR
jgi:DNA transformation protein